MKILQIVLYLLFFTVIGQAQESIIRGTVKDAVNNAPLEFALVQIVGTGFGQMTDGQGRFFIQGVPPGIYDIKVSLLGYDELILSELSITNIRPFETDILLKESSVDLKEVVVKSKAFQKSEESPISLRTIGVTEIARNPGSNRDISKTIKVLPGVTRGVSFRNDLIIRGGAPNENRFYLDDVEVPNINHFATQGSSGGPVGMINVMFIREVDFYSAAFPANRGNALSSVLQFKQRNGRSDRIGGSILAGASDVGLTLEGPISEKTNFIFSARRSYLQLLFKALELPFLPIYNDFQAKISYKIDGKNEIYFTGLGAIDDFELNLEADDTETQQYILSYLPKTEQWNYVNGLVYKNYQTHGFTTVVLSRNMLRNMAEKYANNQTNDPSAKTFDYTSSEIENKLRIEQNYRYGDHKLNAGINFEQVKYDNTTYNLTSINNQPSIVNFSTELSFYRYGFFAQYSHKFLEDRLSLSAGVRMDGNNYSDLMSNILKQTSPRLSLSYQFIPNWSVNASYGRFFQLPPYTMMGYANELNKSSLTYLENEQFAFGLEWLPGDATKITVEYFNKNYFDYPMLTRDSITLANLGGDFGIIGNEPAVPFADGRTQGIECMLQQKLWRGFYGIVSYTFASSKFEDKNKKLIASAWDSRHILNITGGKRLGKNWEIGINVRYQSGLPTTPPRADADLVQIWNINNRALPDYNLINTQRQEGIIQIDARIDKKWFFKRWNLNIYLDVENLTAASVPGQSVILDRPLDADNKPIGSGIIVNPNDPIDQQRYRLKSIEDNVGTLLPSIGVMVEF